MNESVNFLSGIVDFSQWSLSIEGMLVERSPKDVATTLARLKLFERLCARARGASSSVAEMRKIIGVKKSTMEREKLTDS